MLFKYILAAVVAGCMVSFSHAYEDRDFIAGKQSVESLAPVLLTKQEWVKYPAYSNREGWDKLTGPYKENLIRQGEKFLDYEWKVVKATDYLEFERSGDRNIMSDPFNSNVKAVTALFLAEMAEGKGRFVNSLADGVYYLCEMTTWVSSAHLVVQKSRRAIPDHREHIIDLTSGNTGVLLSWIHYFLHGEFDKIDPVISERVRHEIDRRILTPYLERSNYWWQATNSTKESPRFANNWNPWCNCSVLECFLLMEKDPERMQQGVFKTMGSVDKFINYVKSDGACEEGPAYWDHAAGKMYEYLQVLYDATNGKVNVFAEPMIKRMGEYICRSYVGDDWVVNFADAGARLSPDWGVVFRYGKAIDSKNMMQFASYLRERSDRKRITGHDIFRTLENLTSWRDVEKAEPKHGHADHTWYPETEFCYMTAGKAFFAAKGGHNDESHNHNDIGTFILFLDNVPVFIDAGVGTYMRQTFSSERYTIWSMQSDYHNLPSINGHAQKAGKAFKSSGVVFSPESRTFSLDIAKAYPAEVGITKWQRTYQFSDRALQIGDDFDLESPSKPNKIRFMIWGDVKEESPGNVLVKVKDSSARLAYDAGQFDLEIEPLEMTDKRFINVWGRQIYRITLTAKQVVSKGTYSYTVSY